MLSRVFKGGVFASWTSVAVIRSHFAQQIAKASNVGLSSRAATTYHISWFRALCTWPNERFPPTTEWGYRKQDGPSTWPQKYPQAGGSNQSPIDIQTEHVQPAPELKENPLTWKYSPGLCKSIVNTGCGWRVDVDPDGDNEHELTGGPLEHSYKFVQFHSHWGDSTECGSEHTVDGKKFAGELHFVHWNIDLYSKCADAVSAPTGLTVLAVLLEIGDSNLEIQELCEAVKTISFKDQRSDIPSEFVPSSLFPEDHSYWTYSGSLTTPPCYESVTWVVFKQPITISEEQLECFRTMHCHCDADTPPEGEFHGLVKLNYRPAQNVNDRVIRECSLP